jgi:hypothetical protein
VHLLAFCHAALERHPIDAAAAKGGGGEGGRGGVKVYECMYTHTLECVRTHTHTHTLECVRTHTHTYA